MLSKTLPHSSLDGTYLNETFFTFQQIRGNVGQENSKGWLEDVHKLCWHFVGEGGVSQLFTSEEVFNAKKLKLSTRGEVGQNFQKKCLTAREDFRIPCFITQQET